MCFRGSGGCMEERMAEKAYRYIIVGGGLAGGSAVEGVRERDAAGSVLLIGGEQHLPYDRPPLTKKLWFGKKEVQDIFLHDQAFYADRGIDLALGSVVVTLNPGAKTIEDAAGNCYRYDKLLLATGGAPRRLGVPGGDAEGICYFRYLDDYLATRAKAQAGRRALVIGGGFIGAEIAAALNTVKVEVTMVYPSSCLVSRVVPESLGRALEELYRSRGVAIEAGESVLAIERRGDRFVTQTRSGKRLESDIVIAGIGIGPAVELARSAELQVENGIVVNEMLQTANADIYAAGDNADFPYQALGRRMRIEHWDNAVSQGRQAGRNLAGAGEPFTYMPYFFSDLFEFGYEAVGDVDSRLETLADWQKENDTGVIYYLEGGRVRGAMMCNVWDRVEDARRLIREGKRMTADDLRGAIR